MEYRKAQEELRALEGRLEQLQQNHPIGSKGFTKAGIRKMIARLHEELAMQSGKGSEVFDGDVPGFIDRAEAFFALMPHPPALS